MHTGTCPFHRDGPLRSPIALAVVMPEPARRGPLWVLLGWLVGGWLSTGHAQTPGTMPQLSLEMYGLDEGLYSSRCRR